MAIPVLCATLAGVSQAKVFWRWGAAGDSVRAIESCGGKIAYAADVTVNSGRGRLTVFGFDAPLERVLASLRGTFGGAEFSHRGGSMAMASVIGARRTVRVVAVQLGIDQTVVFDLDQSEAEAEASRRPPADASVKDLPPYPSAEPVFLVRDDRASMGAVVYRTPAGADTVQKFYEGALLGAGWKSVAPERGLREQSLRVYVSNDRVCCVLVEASRTEGMSRITVLHKERGIEY